MLRRDGKKFKRAALGPYPKLSLARARQLATLSMDELEKMIGRGNQVPAEAEPPAGGTLGELCQFKIDDMEAEGKRKPDVVAHYLTTGPDNAADYIGRDRPAADITPADATDWLRRLGKRGVRSTHPRKYLHADCPPSAPMGHLR